MDIKEKIRLSKQVNILSFHREGLFYKCYNEDAMVFATRVKPYKVSVKYIKCVGAEVLSLGFPHSEVKRGNLSFSHILESLGAEKYDEENERVVFYLKDDLKQDFEEWRKTVVENNIPKSTKKVSCNADLENHELISLIKYFDLANSTPMQCLQFIQELKTVVQNLNKS